MDSKKSIVLIRKTAINFLVRNEENEEFAEKRLSGKDTMKSIAEIRGKALFDIENGKGFDNAEKILSELSECLAEGTEESSEDEISKTVNEWIKTLKKGDSAFFIRRYWFGERRTVLSSASFMTAEKLDKKLFSLRKSLREYFAKKGISVNNPETVFSAISGTDGVAAEKAQDYKWKKSIYRFWQFWAVIAAIVLAVAAAILINSSKERNSEYNYYFRDCVLNWSESDYSYKNLEGSIEYEQSKSFGYMRKSIEKEGTIPYFKEYQVFAGTGYYGSEGELKRLSLTWEHVAYMGYGYKKIRISFVPGTEDVVPESMRLPLTEAGRAIPDVTTITSRDGILIYGVTDGRAVMVESSESEKVVRKLMFYKDGYWIEMDGLKMGAKDMGEFLEWLFEDEIELGRFEKIE